MKRVELSALDFCEIVRPGDTVLWGQNCGEPVSLCEALLAQRHSIGRFNVFMGSSFSNATQPAHADVITFRGIGAIGGARRLTAAKVLEVVPSHISSIDRYVAAGLMACDIVLVQVSPPDADGRYSMGLISDYIRTAVDKARVVVAEINALIPQTHCESPLSESDIDILVEVSREPPEVPRGLFGDVHKAIARVAVDFVPDRATLQMGNGAVPEAIVAMLKTRRGLGVHSGVIGDSMAELMRDGIVTNEFKEIDVGLSVTGCLMGTRALFDFAHRNPRILMCAPLHTHATNVLQRLSHFVSINSAMEVDLTGQVNAESVDGEYVGAVGGQVDYVRAAAGSDGGCSIIALPALAKDGGSKIVASLSGPVTTARSDAGVIVTEFGAADLRGKSLQQRRRAMIAIAGPAHREALERAAYSSERKKQ
jgi:acyl-CoA hydrolase